MRRDAKVVPENIKKNHRKLKNRKTSYKKKKNLHVTIAILLIFLHFWGRIEGMHKNFCPYWVFV